MAIIRWLVAFGALAGIVLVYRRWLHVNPTTVALTLLLLILFLAAEWGLLYAVVVSLAATACYNFYFLPPVGTFTISDPQIGWRCSRFWQRRSLPAGFRSGRGGRPAMRGRGGASWRCCFG